MFRHGAAIIGMLLGLSALAAAQGMTSPLGNNFSPMVGGTGGAPPPVQLPRFSGSPIPPIQLHRRPGGSPCLTVGGYAQQQAINQNIFELVITINNDCSQLIKVKVCYYESQDCSLIDVPGYGRKESTLGIMPGMKDFRFEYTEQFDQRPLLGGFGNRHY